MWGCIAVTVYMIILACFRWQDKQEVNFCFTIAHVYAAAAIIIGALK